MTTPTPVTLISGYLGAGKTTLLNHILNESQDQRLAVLVNDFGELNIDADLIQEHDGETYTLTNGCVCCSIANSFAETLFELAERHQDFDDILVEASGVAKPNNLCAAVTQYQNLILAGVIVLIDATSIITKSRDPYIGNLLTDQLAQADLLVINKVDLIDADQQSAVDTWLAAKSQETPRIFVTYGNIPVNTFFGRFESRAKNEDGTATDHEALFYSTVLLEPLTISSSEFEAAMTHPGNPVIRAKGVVEFPGNTFALLQAVGARTTLEACEPQPTQCIFIGLKQNQFLIDQCIKQWTTN